MVTGMVPQQHKGFRHLQTFAFRDDSFGLFENDPTVERGPKLIGDDLGLERGSILKDRNRGQSGDDTTGLSPEGPRPSRASSTCYAR